jgi:hypothetical protein
VAEVVLVLVLMEQQELVVEELGYQAQVVVVLENLEQVEEEEEEDFPIPQRMVAMVVVE